MNADERKELQKLIVDMRDALDWAADELDEEHTVTNLLRYALNDVDAAFVVLKKRVAQLG